MDFEKMFNIEDLDAEKLAALENFKQFEEKFNKFEEMFNMEELPKDLDQKGLRCGCNPCYWLGIKTIMAALKTEFAVAWGLIQQICYGGMTADQYIAALQALCCVKQSIVAELELGGAWAGCSDPCEE